MNRENDVFYSAVIAPYIPLTTLLKQQPTYHMDNDRKKRRETALSFLEENDRVLFVFELDKGHVAGVELHCVTSSGLIFILNKNKFLHNTNCLVTILLARPGQVSRLFKACKREVPRHTLNKCIYYQKNQLNKI